MNIKPSAKPNIKEVISIIDQTSSYNDYENHIKSLKLDSTELGDYQEIFAFLYFSLQHDTLYQVERYVSYSINPDPELFKELQLPEKDRGTDAVIIHTNGKFSLVQVKWRTEKSTQHKREAIANMAIDALKSKPQNIYLFSNVSKVSYTLPKGSCFKYILYDTLKEIDWPNFQQNVSSFLDNSLKTITPTTKPIIYRSWQINAAKFVKGKKLSTIVAACGSGKTLTGYKIIKQQKTYKILILVPSLQLMSQWFQTIGIRERETEYLLIGSQHDKDMNDVPYNITTDPKQIQKIINKAGDKFITFCTYHSLEQLFECENVHFNLVFCDEAHLTTGKGKWSLVHEHDFADRKIFLTATPKTYKGVKVEKCVSMNDESKYGQQFNYSCRQAIEDKFLADYKMLLGYYYDDGISDEDRYQAFARFLNMSIEDKGLKKILVTSNSHAQSKEFYEVFRQVYPGNKKNLVLMSQNAKAAEKNTVLNRIENDDIIIVFSVRIFSLGTDMPALQGVFFNGDKKSQIDIVQTAMRCLRKHDSKKLAYIMVPCFTVTEIDSDKGEFTNIRNTLLALGSTDKVLMDEIVLRAKNAKLGNGCCGGSMIECVNVDEKKILDLDKIELLMFDRLGEANEVSPQFTFDICIDEINKKGDWVGQHLVINGVKVGVFQQNLKSVLSGRIDLYPDFIEGWHDRLKELSCYAKLKAGLDKMKIDRKITKATPNEKLDICIREIIKKGDWVVQSLIVDGIKIGKFQDEVKGVLTGRNNTKYSKYSKEWHDRIKVLDCYPKLKKALDKMIEKRKREKISPNEKFDLWIDAVDDKNNWVGRNCIIDGIQIGEFELSLKSALTGRNLYKKNIEGWHQRIKLLECYPKLKETLDKMIKKRKIEKIPSTKKFDICISEIDKKGDWVNRDLKIDGIKIGIFQDDLKGILTGRINKHKKYKNEWIKRLKALKCWPKLKERIDKIIADRK